MTNDNVVKIAEYSFRVKGMTQVKHDDYKFLYANQFMTEKEFRGDLIEETEGRKIRTYKGGNGIPMVMFDEAIPTFDSGDRMYDSFQRIYILKEKGRLTGYYLHGGYRLSDVKKLTDVSGADQKTIDIMEQYGLVATDTPEMSEKENDSFLKVVLKALIGMR